MRRLFAFSLLVLSSQMLWAQSSTAQRETLAADVETQRRIQQENVERWAFDPTAGKRALTAKQALALEEFYSKAKDFVELWQAFAVELNSRKTLNAKLAKKISKAFHDLERSEGWPAGHAPE